MLLHPVGLAAAWREPRIVPMQHATITGERHGQVRPTLSTSEISLAGLSAHPWNEVPG